MYYNIRLINIAYSVQIKNTITTEVMATLNSDKRSIDLSEEDYLLAKVGIDALAGAGIIHVEQEYESGTSKRVCRVATTENITLEDEQTIDTISVVNGDRVLVKDQTDPIENGLYKAVSGAAWERALDFDAEYKIKDGQMVPVASGAVGGDSLYMVNVGEPFVIDESEIAFVKMNA